MRPVWLLLALACGCTQDFGAFEPAPDGSAGDASDASQPADASDASSTVDAPVDAAACTEPGAVVFGGHCYFLVETMQTFDAAETECASTGAHLVTITGSAEQSTVAAIGAGIERWIGLERTTGPATDANYQWVTGEARDGFNAWAPGEPRGVGMCGRMLANGTWADQDCSATLASICERE